MSVKGLYKYVVLGDNSGNTVTRRRTSINSILRGFSTLSGALRPVLSSGTTVTYRPVNAADSLGLRAWVRLLAYGSLVCTLVYAVILFWPTHWVALRNPLSVQTPANWAILACLLTLQGFVILATYAAVRATLTARTPVPLVPPAGLRAAFVTTRAPGEPVRMVEATLRAAVKVRYPKGTVDVWLLDETDSPVLKALCRDLGVRYFTRAGDERWNQVKTAHTGIRRVVELLGLLRHPAYDPAFAARTKHGNFNAWLAHLDEYAIGYDILAGVDTDHVPHPNYLQRLLGYFHDPDVAYVVGPQVYGNYRPGTGGLVTRWCESQASFFQSTIQRAANASDSAMLVGTNYAIRMDALRQVGGFQPCITEDMATGLVIHANRNLLTGNRWKSVYTPDVLAIGEGPETWASYFTQQWRWAAGTFDVWRRIALRSLPRMRPLRALHYVLILGFYPIVALTWLLAALSSGLYLVLGASAVDASFGHVLSLYLVCSVLQVSLYFWNRRFNVSPHEPRGSLGVAGMAMTALTGPIYLSALVGTLRGKRPSFVVTKKGGVTAEDTLKTFRLPLAWFGLLLAMLAWGLLNAHTNSVMLAWALIVIVLSAAPVLLGYRAQPATSEPLEMTDIMMKKESTV